jgi:hypothetical protein
MNYLVHEVGSVFFLPRMDPMRPNCFCNFLGPFSGKKSEELVDGKK